MENSGSDVVVRKGTAGWVVNSGSDVMGKVCVGDE